MLFDENIVGVKRDVFISAVQKELPKAEDRPDGELLSTGFAKPIYLLPLFQKKIAYGANHWPFSYDDTSMKIDYSKGICPVTEDIEENKMFINDYVRPPANIDDMKDVVNAFVKVYENKKDLYIDLHGNIFPTSTKFSERVILIHTADNINFDLKNINSTDYGKKIFTMINYIINDIFLSKIISEIDINYNKNIIIYPQVSKQKIIFGYPEKIDVKFDKLMLFYKKILPAKGWNTYKSVNLKFKNQIICDKKA